MPFLVRFFGGKSYLTDEGGDSFLTKHRGLATRYLSKVAAWADTVFFPDHYKAEIEEISDTGKTIRVETVLQQKQAVGVVLQQLPLDNAGTAGSKANVLRSVPGAGGSQGSFL